MESGVGRFERERGETYAQIPQLANTPGDFGAGFDFCPTGENTGHVCVSPNIGSYSLTADKGVADFVVGCYLTSAKSRHICSRIAVCSVTRKTTNHEL
jgi:hypothetical protein